MKPARFNRVIHRWASLVIALPLLIVIVTGLLLLLKKHIAWIQPPTQRGATRELSLGFDRVLEIAQSVPAAEIADWDDIDRLEVRPSKGMLKVRVTNRWEIQIDAASGEILQVAYPPLRPHRVPARRQLLPRSGETFRVSPLGGDPSLPVGDRDLPLRLPVSGAPELATNNTGSRAIHRRLIEWLMQ